MIFLLSISSTISSKLSFNLSTIKPGSSSLHEPCISMQSLWPFWPFFSALPHAKRLPKSFAAAAGSTDGAADDDDAADDSRC